MALEYVKGKYLPNNHLDASGLLTTLNSAYPIRSTYVVAPVDDVITELWVYVNEIIGTAPLTNLASYKDGEPLGGANFNPVLNWNSVTIPPVSIKKGSTYQIMASHLPLNGDANNYIRLGGLYNTDAAPMPSYGYERQVYSLEAGTPPVLIAMLMGKYGMPYVNVGATYSPNIPFGSAIKFQDRMSMSDMSHYMRRNGTINGSLRIAVYKEAEMTPLYTGPWIDFSNISTAFSKVTFPLPLTLDKNTLYMFLVEFSSAENFTGTDNIAFWVARTYRATEAPATPSTVLDATHGGKFGFGSATIIDGAFGNYEGLEVITDYTSAPVPEPVVATDWSSVPTTTPMGTYGGGHGSILGFGGESFGQSARAGILNATLTVNNVAHEHISSIPVIVHHQTSAVQNSSHTAISTSPSLTQVHNLQETTDGVELVTNGGFETGSGTTNANFSVPGWLLTTPASTSTVTIDTVEKYSGNQSIKMTVDESNSINGIYKPSSEIFTVEPNTTYEFSFRYKSSVAGQLQAGLVDSNTGTRRYLQTNGTWSTSAAYIASVNTTTSWKEYRTRFTTASNQTTLNIYEIKRSGFSNQANKTFWIDDVSVAKVGSYIGHTATSPLITETPVLIASPAAHGLTSTELALVSGLAVLPASSIIGQVTSDIHLNQLHSLGVDDTSHSLLSDILSIIEAKTLGIQGAVHGQTTGIVAATQEHIINAGNSTHTSLATSPAVLQHALLAIQDALQATSSDAVAIIQYTLLSAPSSSTHGVFSEAIGLTHHQLVEIEEALHDLSSGNIKLVNWTELGVGFGILPRTDTQLGEFAPVELGEGGIYIPNRSGNGEFQAVEISEGVLVRGDIQTGNF